MRPAFFLLMMGPDEAWKHGSHFATMKKEAGCAGRPCCRPQHEANSVTTGQRQKLQMLGDIAGTSNSSLS